MKNELQINDQGMLNEEIRNSAILVQDLLFVL
jgi:hypothetical protein